MNCFKAILAVALLTVFVPDGHGIGSSKWVIACAAAAESQGTASGLAVSGLAVDEKDQAAAVRDDKLIILLNLQNRRDQLEHSPDITALVIATSTQYAKAYLAKPEYKQIKQATVHPVYIQSMDEYRNANFAGMKRLGTITFERTDSGVSIRENKLMIH